MLRLAGSDAVSEAALVTIEPSAFFLLVGMYLTKNLLLLTTSEPSRSLGKKGRGRIMDKVETFAKTALASVVETIGGLGISNPALVGSLA